MKDEKKVTKEDSSESVKYLYLCDGYACPEEKKKFCFTQKIPSKMACMHTSDKAHAITQLLKGIIPTKFDPLPGKPDVLVEHFDYAYSTNEGDFQKWFDTKINNNRKEKTESSESDD